MHRFPLSVDARLRIVLAHLDILKLPVRTATDPSKIPQLRTRRALASWLADLSDVAASHLNAARFALPATCRTLDAPPIPEASTICSHVVVTIDEAGAR